MEPGRWARITDIYHSTIARPPEERASFVGEECHGDESLRKQVEAMVRSHERSGNFIESPAFAFAPELLIDEPTSDLIGQSIGHYRVESLLGVGGMGEVYLARDELLGRKVALKLLPEHLTEDETQLTRFTTEARTASALNHPNILTVHEIGAKGKRHFIATEFIEGITLRVLLARGRINLHDALEIAVQVGSALAAAHETGVVHRDIKPENIMLRPDGYAKVLDFGIAKLAEQQPASDLHKVVTTTLRETRPGLVIGTAQYMSPEQARGQAADARSDIWSLGVVLYEMVGGVPPFSGATPSDCIASILTAEPPPLSGVLSGVPVKLQSIVQKALRKNKDERYQTIKEMLSDLRSLKGDLEAEGLSRPAFSKIKRHKRGALLALLAVILAAAAFAYRFYFVSPTPLPNEKSIAVLPFADLSQAGDQEYFCDGIQEEILTRLAKVGTLKVIARTSTQRFKSVPPNLSEIGKQLGVVYLLEGSVQKAGNQVRVNAQLIRAEDASHLWAETYDRNLNDIFAVESQIATKIADTLKATLTSEQRAIATRSTENPEAHQLYLYGRYFWNKRTGPDLQKAIGYFKRAIEKDPTYALAHAGLADAYVLLPGFGAASPQESLPLAKAAAQKALELDDALAEAHSSLGLVLICYDFDLAGSMEEFERAIQLNPNYATAHQWFGNQTLILSGDFDRAIAEGKRAVELDPLSLIINADLGIDYFAARRYDEAIEQLLKTIEIDPRFYYAHWLLGEALEMKGQLPEALKEYKKAAELDDDPAMLGFIAEVSAKMGRRDEALKILAQLQQLASHRYVSDYTFALVHLALDENETAIEWLERAYEHRAGPDIMFIKLDPMLNPLRGHPQFERLVSKVFGTPENKSRAQLTESKSIAVLPFENLSSEPDTAYFADGIQEEILTRLAKIADLKVISRTSTRHYKSAPDNLPEIAKQLGVAHIVEGTIQKSADQVRVNVQLIDAQNDSHLWANKYDRKLTDIFAVESEIAETIADSLQAKLTGAEQHAIAARPTQSTAAYQLYLKGRFFWNKRTGDDLKKALDYFNQAVATDPNYALAYAGISDVYQLLPNYSAVAPKDCLPKAEIAAKKALELDNTLAEAHNSLAYGLAQRFEFAEAEKEFKRAIELNPNYATARQWYSDSVLAPTERLQEALVEMKRALEVDPLSPIINAELALAYEAVDRYDEAIEQFHKTIELEPGFYKAHLWLGNALAAHGDLAAAIAEYQRASELSDDPGIPAGLAWAYAALGNKKEAVKIVDQLQERSKHQYVPAAIFSLLYLALGNKDEAMRWLEKSYEDGAGIDLQGIRGDRRMAPLRGDPRFEKFVNRIVPPTIRPAGTTSIPEKSIAVLPFENRSEDKANAYFADGVQDEILTRLSKIGDLKVISRTSTQRYKSTSLSLAEIAKQLGVATLLEGSVQKANDQVRVNVQLIRASNDSHLWAETYDRRLTDIFAVESEVASTIADKLQAVLTGSEQQAIANKPTVNLDAYDAYLHGIEFDRRSELPADLMEAIRYLKLAVKLDPTFALAWARLGRVEAGFYFRDIDIHPARLDAARHAVEAAVRLQPDLGESWLASGYYHLYCERNRELARAAFEKARQRLPNDSDVLLALSIVDLSQGRPDNALALQTEALRLDPRNASLFFQQGDTLAALRRFDEARLAADNALMITPNDEELKAFKAITYQAEGDLERAHQTFGENSSHPWTAPAYPLQLRQLMLERNYAEMISRLGPLLAERAPSTAINQDSYCWLLGMAQKLTGDLKGAQSTFAQGRDFLLATIQKSGGPQGAIHATIAVMYAGVGDKPNALREAKRAVELEGDDTYYAPAAEEVLAIVEAQTGETARAVARLPKLLKSHYFSWLSYAPLTPALLQIDPVWDPLRDDPLFQKLINEENP